MVAKAMAGTLQRIGGNPGRAGHMLSLSGGRVISHCRDIISKEFCAPDGDHVIFTANCTEALNIAIRGMLYQGDEVICSHAEHNAVMRVLCELEKQNMITVKTLTPASTGILTPQAISQAISPKTALCVLSHASNVTGIVQPIETLSKPLKDHGIPLLVDAAQTAGILPLSLPLLGADMIAKPGHKGLLGPHGTGVLVLGKEMLPRPFIMGGTGSVSESMLQPDDLPDRLESGTPNLPGIAGLLVGARFAFAHRQDIHAYEHRLIVRLRNQLESMRGLRVLGSQSAPFVGVVSFVVSSADNGEFCDALATKGFALRAGLHCAPAMHEWLGTLHTGAIRASVGIYNTEEQVDALANAIRHLLRR